ncbi:MAG: glycoside hydrolase family 25 protein [Candidatus Pacebacteria bacterium]|nr:glycoside hydrolase family 25 protein [Candidatus Paceibacterota bacterium]
MKIITKILSLFGYLLSLVAKAFELLFVLFQKILRSYPRSSGAFLTAVMIFLSLTFLKKEKEPEEIVVEVIDESSNFGIDISQYQGVIDWDKVDQSKHPIKFVIIRSTAGKDRQDTRYWQNLEAARAHGYKVGTYHYYDPNENSTQQARNFIANASVRSGDFVPIVDIERPPREDVQNFDRLRDGLRNYLRIIEKHYGVKPMIYTGLSYYKDNLMAHQFDDYPKWLAAYDPARREDPVLVANANLHQFSEQVPVEGIEGLVDGNDITKDDTILTMP